ncbi:MAG: putative baseplate assembly protein, partial [Nitrosospira sp.]
RKAASLFGHNAPKEPQYESGTDIQDPKAGKLKPQSEWCEWTIADDEAENVAYLDTVYDQVVAGSQVVIQQPPFSASSAVVATVDNAVAISRAAYGLTGKTSMLTFNKKWWNPEKIKVNNPANPDNPDNPSMCNDASSFGTLRATTIYCQSEELILADEPIREDICEDEIELDGLYDGLKPGQWMIVSGERADIPGTTGVKASELVMLAEIVQKTQTRAVRVLMRESNDKKPGEEPLPGDKLHTFIKFDKDLAYCYKRDTVIIYGNVVKATHGETRREVLGSGDAAKAFQSFQLKQFPLTYVSAPTVSGIESTLEIRVNDVQWHETGSLPALGRNDRKLITFQDDDEKTSITFGNGERGARLPTGQENITSVYRNGIGKPGNVKADQISLLATRPLGVKGVINPIRASGGADRESRDQARKNAPLALMALDRLVSIPDYANFTRTFAGIGKAGATRLTDRRKQVVQVTIAGAEDIPIEVTSDLYRNLHDALHRHGDPHLPIVLQVRERLALVISAKVGVDPDYLWESLEPTIRSAVLDAFGFEKLELGEDLLLANAVRVIQGVRGVTYVDVDVFDTISEDVLLESFIASEEASFELRHRIPIEPTQIAYLSPDVPDTLILQEIKP